MEKNSIRGNEFSIKAYLKADPFSQQCVIYDEKGERKELVTDEMFWGKKNENGLYLDYTLVRNRKIEVLEGISPQKSSQILRGENCDKWLQRNFFDLNESKVFVVKGYAGCGKTTFMNKLLQQRKINENAFYVDIGKDWDHALESFMFFNESLNAFDNYIEHMINAKSTREKVWEKFIEMGSELIIKEFDLQIPNIIAQIDGLKERFGWRKIRTNLRGYLFDTFGNKNDNPKNFLPDYNNGIWHNCGQTQTVISLLILMICANFWVKKENGILSKSYMLIYDNLDVITDPVISAENVLTLWGIISKFMHYKCLYKQTNMQDLPKFGIFITVRKVLNSYITTYLPDLEMGINYDSYYINVCDISNLYLSQDILKNRIAFWTKYVKDYETINKLKQLEKIETIHAKPSLQEYDEYDDYEDIFEVHSSIDLDAFFNHNYRALSNVLSEFLEDKRYTKIFLQDFDLSAHSKNWQKVATLVFEISLLYKNGKVWNKMGFGCEDFSLLDFPTTLNRLILNYLYIARRGQILYSYKDNWANLPCDEKVSLRDIISLFEKVKFVPIEKKYNERQIYIKYESEDPLLTRCLIIERLADMCARNIKADNSYAHGYDTDADELWRRPLYFVNGVKMNHTAATDVELYRYFKESLNKGKDDQIFFSITDEGFVLIHDIVANFEFYSARYCKSTETHPLHQAISKNEIDTLITPVYNAVKLCCKRHSFFMDQYMKEYSINKDKYLNQFFHPRTNPRFEDQIKGEKRLSNFSFRPQLHIVRVIYAHVDYFDKVKEILSKSDIVERDIMCQCLTDWIGKYLNLYKRYFFNLLTLTDCRSDNNVYLKLKKLFQEQKKQYEDSGDKKNICISIKYI